MVSWNRVSVLNVHVFIRCARASLTTHVFRKWRSHSFVSSHSHLCLFIWKCECFGLIVLCAHIFVRLCIALLYMICYKQKMDSNFEMRFFCFSRSLIGQ